VLFDQAVVLKRFGVPLEQLIEQYGYLAVFIGTFLEGETILVVAGFAAHRGYLYLPWVMVWAFWGTLISDQAFFHLGRSRGRKILSRHPKWQGRARKVHALLQRHQVWVVLGFRFLYGLRNVTPMAIGVSGFSPGRFLILNVIGAALWSSVVACAGFIFGEVLTRFIADMKHFERWAFLGIIALGAIVWVVLPSVEPMGGLLNGGVG